MMQKPALSNLRLPVRIGAGVRAKLDFDYACGRGHSFGEYHVHGVVNEILCSGLDPTRHRIHSGFPHPRLQAQDRSGRPREVDFAIESLADGTHGFVAEVKWAGSSHCTPINVLRDLCRLQLIKNAESATESVFVLAGRCDKIDELFAKGILRQGTECLLHKTNERNALNSRGRKRRTKRFALVGNTDHDESLSGMRTSMDTMLPAVPDRIYTCLSYSAQSASTGDRFQALVWSIETSEA